MSSPLSPRCADQPAHGGKLAYQAGSTDRPLPLLLPGRIRCQMQPAACWRGRGALTFWPCYPSLSGRNRPIPPWLPALGCHPRAEREDAQALQEPSCRTWSSGRYLGLPAAREPVGRQLETVPGVHEAAYVRLQRSGRGRNGPRHELSSRFPERAANLGLQGS